MMYECLCTICPRCGLEPTLAYGVEAKAGVEGRWRYVWVTHCGLESDHIQDTGKPTAEFHLFQAINNWNLRCKIWNQ